MQDGVFSDQTGDRPEKSIDMPVTKSELNLLQLALQEYKHQIEKSAEAPAKLRTVVLFEIQKLESKLLSNEKSLDSI